MEDAEKIGLYAKAVASEHHALEESPGKAKSRSRYWERNTKEGTKRVAGTENEREKAEEAHVTGLVSIMGGEAKAWVDEDQVRVQGALAVTEEAKAVVVEARRKAEVKATRLEVDWMSLLLDLGMTKDEVSSLQSQANKDKEAMEEEYQKTLEVIFAYDYKCYVFKHNICGDQPKVPGSMPDSADPLLPEFL